MARSDLREVHQAHQHRVLVPGVEAVSLATGRSFPRHSHDAFGIGVITAGGHRSWSGIGPVEAGPGDVITVNPGEVHDGLPASPGAARRWHMVYLAPELVGQADADIRPELAQPVARDALLAQTFGTAFARLVSGDRDPLAADEAVTGLCGAAFRRLGAAAAPRPHSCPVGRVRERLDDAPEGAVSLADLAALAGVSRFQLLRAFAKEVGLSPHAYLRQRRVQRAKALLARGVAPAEAAAACGFADQSHLTRAFVRQLGVTPGHYRAAFA